MNINNSSVLYTTNDYLKPYNSLKHGTTIYKRPNDHVLLWEPSKTIIIVGFFYVCNILMQRIIVHVDLLASYAPSTHIHNGFICTTAHRTVCMRDGPSADSVKWMNCLPANMLSLNRHQSGNDISISFKCHCIKMHSGLRNACLLAAIVIATANITIRLQTTRNAKSFEDTNIYIRKGENK